MELFKTFDNKLAKIVPIAFILLTLVYSLSRIPFYDEAYAFIISRLSLNEIFHLTRIEGHPILWYLILKPFSSLNLYPYSMLIINWIFSSVMILFFWRYAPFNNLIKTLITFSYPFFNYLGVVARPYALNVLSIFLLAYFYKKEKTNPCFFAFLLVFCANITIMGTFSSVAFFVLFVKQLIEKKNISKKALMGVFIIFVFGALIFLAQLINFETPEARPYYMMKILKDNLSYFFYRPLYHFQYKTILQSIFQLVCCLIFYTSIFIFFKKSKNALIYLSITYSLLTFLFLKIYIGAPWHYYFYFINFIVAIWICWDEIKNIRFFNIIFLLWLVLALNPYSYYAYGKFGAFDTKAYIPILNKILDSEYLKNSKVYCIDWFSIITPGILPYLERNNIKVYDINGFEKTTYESIKYTHKSRTAKLVPKEFVKHLDSNRLNYIITQNSVFSKIHSIHVFQDDKYRIFFVLQDSYKNIDFGIYKIIVEKL